MASTFLAREISVAGPGFNRWLFPPAALAVHLSIGQVYAFSVFKEPLVSHFDSSLTAIGIVFSIAIVMLGLSAAVLGTWVERSGPRKSMLTAALCWASGFAVGALGVATDQLWLLYLVAMTLGAFTARVPADDWAPAGFTPATESHGMRTAGDVTAANAIRTRAFWLLWVVLFCNVTAGIGILEQASPMIQDFFSGVDATEAAGYVGLLSLANMAGRFLWSSTSDVIGRKPMYMVYLGVGTP